MSITLTVFYDGQFWVGLLERVDNGSLSVCRIVFGAEPHDSEVKDFILDGFYSLRFSPSVEGVKEEKVTSNPKRMQREIARISKRGVSTKAQTAMKLAYEESKEAKAKRVKEKDEREQQRKFELKQEKMKEKHRGH